MSDCTGYKHNWEREVKTSISIQTYVFKWRLENYPDWPNSFKVTSNEFQPASDIVLFATLERFIDASKGIEFCVTIISKENTSFELEHKLYYTDSTGKVLNDGPARNFVCDDQHKTFKRTLNSNTIINHSKSMEDQIVIMKCDMKIRRLTTENVNIRRLTCSIDPLPTLIDDFENMYVNSFYTDLSLLVNNSVLQVHKSVLCARSPVFSKMLKAPMEENAKEAIVITDIELSILKAFVVFLYTGNAPTDVDFDSWCKLYYAADKYDVASLRDKCADELLDKLDAENSCRVLSMANRHSAVQFLDLVMEFMQCNFESVMETETWFELVVSEPELANRVMRLRAQKSKKSASN